MRRSANRPDHDAGARADSGSARRANEAARTTGAESALVVLQRSAGNRALARAVGDARVVPDPETDATTVPDVLRAGGQPLPRMLRTEMEARLGADFTAVRLHTGSAAQRSAAEIGARAYTSGHHVVLGAGGADRHTLAHELTHVVQQRTGSVAGTPGPHGLSLSDPSDRFEREAEAAATEAMRRPIAAVSSSPSDAAASAADGTVQRLVKVGATSGDRRAHTDDPTLVKAPYVQADAADLITRVTDAVARSSDPTLQAEFAANKAPVLQQATKWVTDSQVGAASPSNPGRAFGTKRHSVDYPTYEEAARALVGWVLQKPGRHDEKNLARNVYSDNEVSERLDAVLQKIERWIAALPAEPDRTFWSGGESAGSMDLTRIWRELKTGRGIAQRTPGAWDEFGTYQRYLDASPDHDHRTEFRGDYLAVLKDPAEYQLRDKVVVLHDLYEYFKAENRSRPNALTGGNGLLPDQPAAPLVESTQQVDPVSGAVRGANKGTRSGTTRDETAPSTVMARQNRIPVFAGQSATTARMLYLAQLAGANTEELTAVALGIFAFWRIDYDHTMALAYHTLHETLDIAKNFGVPYDQDSRDATFGTYATRIEAQRNAERRTFVADSRRTNAQFERQERVLGRAVAALNAEHGRRLDRGYRHRARRADARRSLGAYGDAVRACTSTLDAFANASPDERQARLAEYQEAVSRARELYLAVTDLVKEKRLREAEAAENAATPAGAGVGGP